MDLLAVLGNVELFDGITPDELEAVSKICRERSYHAGDVLTSQGEPGDELYVICDGFVEVLRSETPSDPSPGQLSTWDKVRSLARWLLSTLGPARLPSGQFRRRLSFRLSNARTSKGFSMKITIWVTLSCVTSPPTCRLNCATNT